MQRSWLVVAGLLLAGTGCSRHGGAAAADSEAPHPSSRPVMVHVVNNYSLPMDVFVIGSGITHRLGLVTPGISRDFEIPQAQVDGESVEFQATPAGGGEGVRTVAVRFTRSDTLEFMITTNLLVSYANVR